MKFFLKAWLRTRPVSGPGPQAPAISAESCRPRALPRRLGIVFTQALTVWMCVFVTVPPSRAQTGPSGGEIVFECDFEKTDALRAWGVEESREVSLGPGFKGSRGIVIQSPRGPDSNRTVRVSLPVEKLRGARLKCQARVMAENVSRPPNSWNGVKLMLHVAGPGGEQWPQQNNVFGSFDWKTISFKTPIPRDATSASLILGLEGVSGRVSFDDILVTITRPPATAARTRVEPLYKGHDLPRLRGAMIPTFVTSNDLVTFGREWGANHVRWQFTWDGFPQSPADRGDLAAYDAWLERVLNHVDSLLPVCRQAGLKVLLDLHTPPGGRNPASECRIFHEKRFQASFLNWWEKIARRYRDNPLVWGYDLVNEPVEGTVGEGLLDWQELAAETARRVRAVDPLHAIVVEPAPWGGAAALANLDPIPVSNVVYSVHMYEPFHFTHQGIYGNPAGVSYPGPVKGKNWDKARLRQALQPAVEFQKTYGVQIYVGEFSAIRWAPDDSACRYLKDVIDILEENGWDWAYHAFREWSGWSVEHGSDPKDNTRSQTPTSRQLLLQSWFSKNAKP